MFSIFKKDMFKNIIYSSLTLSLFIILSGCSVYKGQFDCPSKKGIGCESVSKVNELIDDDELDAYTEDLEEKSNKKNNSKRNSSNYRFKTKKGCNCNKSNRNEASNFPNNGEEGIKPEKLTIHFNEYKEKGVLYKESEIEVNIDAK